jgi:branched-chain amino acid transport system substrate-binding protein
MKATGRMLFGGFLALMLCVIGFITVNAADKEPLKIGAIFSATGRASALGLPEKNTALLLMQQVNSKGGINGFPLEVVVVDDQTLASGAKAAAEKLITQDRVLAIIGPSISGNSLEVKPLCESAKVPLVSCAAAEAIVSPVKDSRFTFKTAQLDSDVAIRIMEQLQKMGISKIALLTEKSPFGSEGLKKLGENAAQFKIQVVTEKTFNVNDIDMTKSLKVAKAAGAGAVVTWGLVPTQTIVAKNLKKMGWKVPLFYSHSFGNPKAIRDAGSAVDGAMFPSGRLLVVDELPANHFHKPVLNSYKYAYEKQFGPASTFGGHAYDAFWIVVNAMKEKHVTPTMEVAAARQLIRDGIEQTKGWLGISGEYNMSADDHTGLDKDKSLEMCVVKGGKILPLDAVK